MDFGKLLEDVSQSGQNASGYQSTPVGGSSWQSGLGQAMSGVAQPQVNQTIQQPVTTDENGELLQYGDLNPDPMAGMDFGMAGQGGYVPQSGKDLGKHLGDVFPGGLGAPQADPIVQMFGEDQAGPVLSGINKVWQAPGNFGQKLGGNIGQFLAVGNPFDLF